MDIILAKLVSQLIMPPNPMLLLMILGAIVYKKNQRIGKRLGISGFVLLVLVTLPIVSAPVIALIENVPALDKTQLSSTNAQAIIILAGGSYENAPEYSGDTVSLPTLERITYGAYLHKHSQLPVLVTGGRVYSHNKHAEAELMQTVMEERLHTPVIWQETHSRNTWENAQYSYERLKQEGIDHIILVTHALHMRRAIMCFEKAGFKVTPAPLGFHARSGFFSPMKILPNASAMADLQHAVHELVGILWYKLRY